jgi:hypothetical protein
MRRVIIIENDGGELANQLWNYASVWAYCLERGWTCENWSFFEYAKYFAHPSARSRLMRALFFRPLRGYHKRRGARRAQLLRRLYKALVVWPVRLLHARRLFSSNAAGRDLVYLPPSDEAPPALRALEETPGDIYLAQVSGGVFRNPRGLERHRAALVERFAPAPAVAARVRAVLKPARGQYAHVVGVHLRQGDYKTFKGGRFRIAQPRVREILGEYLHEMGWRADETLCIIASDGVIDTHVFEGLTVELAGGTPGEDLFVLAGCDAVVGSDSTFGHFAAWLGDVPHIIMKTEPMDWAYYRGTRAFFSPNKYLTVMHQ